MPSTTLKRLSLRQEEITDKSTYALSYPNYIQAGQRVTKPLKIYL
jgi:hypothetical protein